MRRAKEKEPLEENGEGEGGERRGKEEGEGRKRRLGTKAQFSQAGKKSKAATKWGEGERRGKEEEKGEGERERERRGLLVSR